MGTTIILSLSIGCVALWEAHGTVLVGHIYHTKCNTNTAPNEQVIASQLI